MSAPRTALPIQMMTNTQTDDFTTGAKAIEVATMLGDSVVDVKHCMDPKSGKITPKTWGLFAAGVLCVAMSAGAFYASVNNAAYNKGGLDYWTQVAKKPAHAFRPDMMSAGYDWLAFGGFVLGLSALAFGLARMRNEKKSPYYRIGTAPGVEQPLEGAPSASFPLVAPAGDDFVFNFGIGMTGDVMVEGKSTRFAELAASGRARPSTTAVGAFEYPIPAHARIRANVGQTSFLVSAVAQPRRHVAPLLSGLESRTVSYFAGSLAVHLGIVLLLSQIPVESSAAAIDLASIEQTPIKSASEMMEDVPPEEIEQVPGHAGTQESSGKAMKLDEGKAGTTKSTNEDSSKMRMRKTSDNPAVARAQALEEARHAGIMGSASLQGADFASMSSMADYSSGFDDVSIYGAIIGAEGEGKGNFGYGRHGFSGGGDCKVEPCGIIGSPTGYGHIGFDKKGTGGWGLPGTGGVGIARRTPKVPGPVIGQPTGSGDLDKSIIRRYIKRNVDKIAYCYEKELLAHPGMEGNIMVTFMVMPTGTVKSATGSGFNATVSNCVADVISAIEFPRPAGGGAVQVNYPFTFHAAGK